MQLQGHDARSLPYHPATRRVTPLAVVSSTTEDRMFLAPHPRRVGLGGIVGALALAVVMSSGGLTPARGALPLPTGLGQLLAAYEPAALARGIATFDAAPTASQAT